MIWIISKINNITNSNRNHLNKLLKDNYRSKITQSWLISQLKIIIKKKISNNNQRMMLAFKKAYQWVN